MTTFIENIVDIETPVQIFEGGHGATNAKQGRENLLIANNNAKNFVIGGNFDTNPWQRGFVVIPNGGSVGGANWPFGSVGPDRFFMQYDVVDGGAYQMIRGTGGPSIAQCGFKVNHCLQISAPGVPTPLSSSFVRLGHAIEGLSGLALTGLWTLSFWVSSTVTGTYSLSIGTPESAAAVYVTTYTINSANTWEQKTITIPPIPGVEVYNNVTGYPVIYWNLFVGSDYNTTILNTWNFGASFDIWANVSGQVNPFSNGTNLFRIALVQAEFGITPTPFEVRSAAQELRLCQRFYEQSYLVGDTPGQVDANNAWLLNPSIKNTTGASYNLSDYIYMTVPKWLWSYNQVTGSSLGSSPDINFYSPATGAIGNAQAYKRSDGTTIDVPVFASTEGSVSKSNNIIEMQTSSIDSFLVNARFYVHWTWAQEPGITLI